MPVQTLAHHRFRHPVSAVASLISAAMLSGCVAFNVGSPETFTHVETVRELSAEPIRVSVLSENARLENNGNNANVELDADVSETFDVQSHTETIVARKQRRLAVGLFPGAAEVFCMPEGALQSGWFTGEVGWDNSPPYHLLYGGESPNETLSYILEVPLGAISSVGIIPAIATLQTLVIEPFSGWSCSHDFFDGEKIKRGHMPKTGMPYWDASKSPKLQNLARFPEDVRKQIGVLTCFDGVSYHGIQFTRSSMNIGHWGLLGCHKYIALYIDPVKMSPASSAGEETRKRANVSVTGPYVADLTIPSLGHYDSQIISAGGTKASFALPAVERDCTVEAVVSFREDNSVSGRSASDLTRQALAKVSGRDWRFDLALKGSGRSSSSVQNTLYEIIEIKQSPDGKYVVRVEIKDKAKTFSIGRIIEPDVKRLIREDYMGRHPEMSPQYIRESTQWETERKGSILVYTGWAFSVQPVADGWKYDPGTRRGTLRLRISDGMPAPEAKRWARENIAVIVADKNVALEADQAPPPGAQYRSLSESFEDGVLTVEFEALQ